MKEVSSCFVPSAASPGIRHSRGPRSCATVVLHTLNECVRHQRRTKYTFSLVRHIVARNAWQLRALWQFPFRYCRDTCGFSFRVCGSRPVAYWCPRTSAAQPLRKNQRAHGSGYARLPPEAGAFRRGNATGHSCWLWRGNLIFPQGRATSSLRRPRSRRSADSDGSFHSSNCARRSRGGSKPPHCSRS